MALNLSVMKGDSNAQQQQDSQPISVSTDRTEGEYHRECQGMIKTRVGMPWCAGGF